MTTSPIDDLSRPDGTSAAGTRWQLVSDRVMGGLSRGSLTREAVLGRAALRLQGDVSLANNGGFLQMAFDLAPVGGTVDASGWTGLEVDATGNGEAYGLHLRTDAVRHPWQSWRAGFVAGPGWATHRLPFASFIPHRIEAALDTGRLRRVGLVAIGRAFRADLSLGALRFYA